ncbi:MAG: hypothetical protein HY796_13745 [Elusimicrobia bacterium]|nr:hypothetical protein [Elusimicrobiota bacterium]
MKHVAFLLLCSVLAVALTVAAWGQSVKLPAGDVSKETESVKPRSDLKGLPNFAKVSDGLYRGAQPTREGFE